MSEIRYLLDENVNSRFHKALRRLSHNMTIRAIGEAGTPPLRTPDPIILNWCVEHDFVLVVRVQDIANSFISEKAQDITNSF